MLAWGPLQRGRRVQQRTYLFSFAVEFRFQGTDFCLMSGSLSPPWQWPFGSVNSWVGR